MKKLVENIRKQIIQQRKRKRLVNSLTAVAGLVVFLMVYVLILPALALDEEAYCGLQTHEHNTSCYEQVLICEQEEHEHSKECYDKNGDLVCRIEEHIHDDSCYKMELVCGKERHVHTKACYEKPEPNEITADTRQISKEITADSYSKANISDTTKAKKDQTGDASSKKNSSAQSENKTTTSNIPEKDQQVDESALIDTNDSMTMPTETGNVEPLDLSVLLTDKTGIWHQKKVESDDPDQAWEQIDEDESLVTNEILRIHLAFQLPKDAPLSENMVTYYDLPRNIDISQETADWLNDDVNGVNQLITGTATPDQKPITPEYLAGRYTLTRKEDYTWQLAVTWDPYVIVENGKSAINSWADLYVAADSLSPAFDGTNKVIFREKTEDLEGLEVCYKEIVSEDKTAVSSENQASTTESKEAADNDVVTDEKTNTDNTTEVEKTQETDTEAGTDTKQESDSNNEDSKDAVAPESNSGKLSYSGADYAVTVSYDKEAGIPEGAELKVKEILESHKDYQDYYDQTMDKLGIDNSDEGKEEEGSKSVLGKITKAVSNFADSITGKETSDQNYARFFDIEIWADGQKIEPESHVEVNIKLEDAPEEEDVKPQVVHFGEKGPEVIDVSKDAETSKGDTIQFVTDEFSVYSVVYTVDFSYNGYGFSIKGGEAIGLKELAEKLHLVEKVSEKVISENEEEEVIARVDSNQEPLYKDSHEFIEDVKSVKFSNPNFVWTGKIEEDAIAWDILHKHNLTPFYPYGMTEQEYIACITKSFDAPDWIIVALNPFDSNETLTITFKNGEEITIRVTDEQNAQMTTDEHGNEVVDTITNPAGTTFDVFDYWILDQNAQGRSAWPGHAGNGNNFSYDYTGYHFDGTALGWGESLWIDPDGDGQYEINPNFLRGYGNNLGINKDHAFKFSPSTGHTVLDGTLGTPTVDGTHRINSYTGNADPTVGLVQDSLTGGYPKLTTNTSLGTNGESLAYLFDSSSHSGKARYSGADHLLYVDEDGYYKFDSRDYWASFDTDSKNFTLTKQTSNSTEVRGFWPFGDRKYWVGMHMNTQFSMPTNGQVLNPKGVYKDMEFEFSGDDDTWLYIDGVLVGDGGGIHNRTDIKINFRTGVVTVTGTEDTYGHAGTYTKTDTLYNIFKNVKGEANLDSDDWKDVDGDGVPDTFADGTYHTFDMFYLERGGGESNLYIHYNLVSTADFTGHKEYHGETGKERLQRNQFKFDLIGLDGQYDTSGNVISGKENIRAIMPVNPTNLPANVTTNASETDAGTVAKPLYLENTITPIREGTEYVNHNSQTYRTGVTEDGNINFGSAVIPEEYIRNYDPDNPTIFHYIVREYVPDEAVNASGKTWAASTEAERREGGYVLNNITYDGTVYYMSAAVTRWRAMDKDGNPKVDSSGNPVYQYGLSKQYFTDDTYSIQLDENHRFINFDNRYMEPLNLKINKKNDSNEMLSGADFKLSKAVFDENNNKWVAISAVAPMTGTTGTNGQLKFENLAAGTYILEETKAPEGYKDAKNKWLVTLTRTDTVTGEGENAVKKSHLEPTITLLNKDGSVPAGESAVSKAVVNHEFDHEILNEVKPPAKITVEKKWLDENGDDLETHPAQITFKVYQLQHQHVWGEWTVTKEATEDEEGARERTCTVDGEKQTEIIPKKDHVHVLVKVDAVAATCTTAGNIEYWECSKDHLKFSDAEGTTQIQDVAIAALGHDYQVTAETAATCTTAGSKTLTCSRCGDSYSETIPELGHNWGDWVNNGDGKETRTCLNDSSHKEVRDAQNLFPGTTDLVLVEKDDIWPVWEQNSDDPNNPDKWKSETKSVSATGIFEDQGNYYVLIDSFKGNWYSWSSFESQNKIQVSNTVSSITDWYSGTGNQQANVPKGTLVKDSAGNYYVRTNSNAWSTPPESDGWYKIPTTSKKQGAPKRKMSSIRNVENESVSNISSQSVPGSNLSLTTPLETLGLSDGLGSENEDTGNKLIEYSTEITTLETPVGDDHLWSVDIPIESEDANGIAYRYYVIEDTPGAEYVTTYSGQENGLVDKGTVTITNQVKPKTGSLRITKNVKINGNTPDNVDAAIKDKADGTYTFMIYKADGTTEVTQKADGSSIGVLSIKITGGDAEREIFVDGLAPGTYVIKEIGSTNDKVLVDSSVSGFDTEKGGIIVTVSAGDTTGAGIAAFTNKYTTYELIVEKVETGSTNTKLGGAIFDLYSEASIEGGKIKDEETPLQSGLTTSKNSSDLGRVSLGYLTPGTYYLVETTAPAGYLLPDDPIQIIVVESGVRVLQGTHEDSYTISQNKAEIQVMNSAGAVLPNTGGPGTRLLMVLGSLMIFFSTSGWILLKRKVAK